jgi:uncharacterized protein YegJ (DUF2314 family)
MNKIILCSAFAITCGLLPSSGKEPTDKGVSVDQNDPERKAAVAKARVLLPHFWETLDAPKRGERGFALKVRITAGKDVEYFWLTPVERKDGKIFGTIDNDPVKVKSVKIGQRIEVPEPDITDWLYLRDDKVVGNYTLRAMLKTMSREKADDYKKKLAEP